jgi:hypothetical protein
VLRNCRETYRWRDKNVWEKMTHDKGTNNTKKIVGCIKEICGIYTRLGAGMFVVSVVCCQVEVSATG